MSETDPEPKLREPLMDNFLRRLLKRGQLEEKRNWENKRFVHLEVHIAQLEELESDTKALEVYKGEIHKSKCEAENIRISITALDGELEYMKTETEAQEKDYDDSDRQERIEEYEKIVCEAKRRMKRDAMIVEQSEREMSRLARDFGRWRGKQQPSELCLT